MKDGKDLSFYNKNKTIFNTYNKMFERFGRDNEGASSSKGSSQEGTDTLQSEKDTLLETDTLRPIDTASNLAK